jgi:hypothetical protein
MVQKEDDNDKEVNKMCENMAVNKMTRNGMLPSPDVPGCPWVRPPTWRLFMPTW